MTQECDRQDGNQAILDLNRDGELRMRIKRDSDSSGLSLIVAKAPLQIFIKYDDLTGEAEFIIQKTNFLNPDN